MFLRTSKNQGINDLLDGYGYKYNQTMQEGRDYLNKSVEWSNNGNDVASIEASFLYVGPPTIDAYINSEAWKSVRALGGVQQYTLNESKQFIPFNEIGSRLKRKVGGSTQYSVNLSRVVSIYGDIKSAVYRWLMELNQNIYLSRLPSAMISDTTPDGSTGNAAGLPANTFAPHLSGLESELFNVPFGIIAVHATAGGNFLKADLLENCTITNAGTPWSAGGVIMVDNLGIDLLRVVPFAGSDGMYFDSSPSVKVDKNTKNYKIGYRAGKVTTNPAQANG